MKKSWIAVWVGMLGLSLLKLWLAEAQSLYVIAYASHDDLLFLKLAHYLLDGKWLGPYDQLTLIKGPFYPAFIAGAHLLGIRLFLAQHLLYVGACWVLTVSLIPALKKPVLSLIFFATLLYNPVSFEISTFRILREGIYTSLTLLVLGCAFGMLFRPSKRWTQIWPWACGFGLSLAAFWLTREEGIWLLPTLGLIIAFSLYKSFTQAGAGWRSRSGLWTGGLAVPILAVLLVSAINLSHYGVFAKTEYDSGIFKSAYGSLTRVIAGPRRPQVPVTRKVRMNIYDVSPTFSELRIYLEGDIGKGWGENGKKTPQNLNEILGGWFMWAFRDSISHAGYYSTGRFPTDFYNRMTAEIDTACSNHHLTCYRKRSTMMPPILLEDVKPLMRLIWNDVWAILRYDDLVLDCPAYYPDPDHDDGIFRRLTGEEFCKTNQEMAASPQTIQNQISNFQTAALHRILDLYRLLQLPLFFASSLAYAALTVIQIIRKRWIDLWVAATILLVGAASRILLVALFQLTSYPYFTVGYMAPAYPLLLGWSILAISGLTQSLPHQVDKLTEVVERL